MENDMSCEYCKYYHKDCYGEVGECFNGYSLAGDPDHPNKFELAIDVKGTGPVDVEPEELFSAYKEEETTDGLKYDVNKVDYTFLQDWDLALAEICKLSEFGAKKYSRGGWTGILDPERLKKAMLRHYFKESTGLVDEDSGFPHDVAVAWNALGALQVRLQNEA